MRFLPSIHSTRFNIRAGLHCLEVQADGAALVTLLVQPDDRFVLVLSVIFGFPLRQ
jgi:hypothetical protein